MEIHNKEVFFTTAERIAARLAKNTDFKLGYEHGIKQIPFDYQFHDERRIAYIRGRAFAIYGAAMKLPRAAWRNDTMSKAATQRLISAIYQRAVI